MNMQLEDTRVRIRLLTRQVKVYAEPYNDCILRALIYSDRKSRDE